MPADRTPEEAVAWLVVIAGRYVTGSAARSDLDDAKDAVLALATRPAPSGEAEGLTLTHRHVVALAHYLDDDYWDNPPLAEAVDLLATAASRPAAAAPPAEAGEWPGSSPIDALTPGWGQEPDPCYLGGSRCSVCPVCPHTPGLTEAERDDAIAARTPAPAAPPAPEPTPDSGVLSIIDPAPRWVGVPPAPEPGTEGDRCPVCLSTIGHLANCQWPER